MVKNFLRFIYNKIRLRGLVHFPYSCSIACSARFEGGNKIGRNTFFVGSMGYGSYIANQCNIHAEIGKYTSIGSNCHFIQGRHPYTYPFAATSPVFFSLLKQNGFSFANRQMYVENKFVVEKTKIPFKIGNDCWINSDVIFVEGVTISDGAVVLAGAVVTKDVPPYAIVGGVPAKILNYRYSQKDIELLLMSKWWDKDKKWLAENWEAFCDFDTLKKKLLNGEHQ